MPLLHYAPPGDRALMGVLTPTGQWTVSAVLLDVDTGVGQNYNHVQTHGMTITAGDPKSGGSTILWGHVRSCGQGGERMIAKRANELVVVTLSAKTLSDLEDVVNDWLKDQSDHVIVQDISFEQLVTETRKQVAWVVATHESE